MALTILQQPEDICLAKNPVWIKVKTTDFVTTEETFAVSYIDFPVPNAPSQYATAVPYSLKFTWGDNEYNFFTKTSAAKDSIQLPLNFTSDIAEYFECNTLLGNDYTVTAINFFGIKRVMFTARKSGTAYNLTIIKDIAINWTITNTAAVNQVSDNNYSIVLNVFLERTFLNNKYQSIFSSKYFPVKVGSDYIIEANIQEILNAELSYDIPDFNFNEMTISTKSIKNFYLRIASKSGASFNSLTIQTLRKVAIKSGINARVFSENKDFLMNSSQPVILLDWEEEFKKVAIDQEDYIYYLIHGYGVAGNSQILFKVTDSDGFTTYVPTDYNSALSYGAGSTPFIAIIPSGFKNSGLKANFEAQNKTVVSYSVCLESETSNHIVLQNYELDRNYYYNEKHFSYINSLSGFTSFRTFGDSETGANISFDEFDINLPNGYTANDFETVKYNALTSEVFEVNTGFISKKEVYKMLDFLGSEKKFISIQNPDESGFVGRIAILVDGNNFSLFKSEDGLFSISFKYKYAQDSKGFNTDKRFV